MVGISLSISGPSSLLPCVFFPKPHSGPPTDLVAGELDPGVVLDLPQALVETLPLVGLAKLVFVLLVGQQVLRAQERSGVSGEIRIDVNVVVCVFLWV